MLKQMILIYGGIGGLMMIALLSGGAVLSAWKK